jgi:hypothetical protein
MLQLLLLNLKTTNKTGWNTEATHSEYKQSNKRGTGTITGPVARFWTTEENANRPTTYRGSRDRKLIINLNTL